MYSRMIAAGAALVVSVVTFSTPSFANDTGVAQALHDTVRVGGKLCLPTHSHYGSGSGPSRKAAEMQAINSWSSFTDFEYGSDWAKLGKAIKKSMTCSQSGGTWSCNLQANACK